MMDEMIIEFGPCIVILHGPSVDKSYGPFETGKHAIEWMNHQFAVGGVRGFSVEPLRTPYRERTYDDWWAGDWHQSAIVGEEFPKVSWFATNRKVLRRWRKLSNQLGKV